MKELVVLGFCKDADEPLVWVEKRTLLLIIGYEDISYIIEKC